MCVNFVSRSIEVFDCEGLKHTKSVEPFAILIPRIIKAVHSSSNSKLKVKQYNLSYVPMPLLNKSSSDCGVYALKHIECHLLGLDFSLRKKENHPFKWVDETLFDEIQRMDEDQARIAKEIEDLRSSMKKTMHEEVMKHKNSLDVGCVASILSILCLCSKCD
ncbi:hypothetical protein F2Q68_00024556 [Brassica cretica]|uniref:Ubiquitin-like protease family profile domain-containing protein n=1 Tax=Brassica cretica TaxID=69181 RepID=A0A8S9I7D5_BRACR|nr:hypothetical protein F2Q68_00024556 [Brassica cretica]